MRQRAAVHNRFWQLSLACCWRLQLLSGCRANYTRVAAELVRELPENVLQTLLCSQCWAVEGGCVGCAAGSPDSEVLNEHRRTVLPLLGKGWLA